MGNFPENHGGAAIFGNPGRHEFGLSSIKNPRLLWRIITFLVDEQLRFQWHGIHQFQRETQSNFDPVETVTRVSRNHHSATRWSYRSQRFALPGRATDDHDNQSILRTQ
jgi:hypothetical protein